MATTYTLKRKLYAGGVGFMTKLTGFGKGGNWSKAFGKDNGLSNGQKVWEGMKGAGKAIGLTGLAATGATVAAAEPIFSGNSGRDEF